MLRSFICLSVVACVFSFGVISVAQRASAVPSVVKQYRIGRFETSHHGTYLMWQLNRSRLGEAMSGEILMQSGVADFISDGTAMTFERGLIVRNFSQPTSGSITVVHGEMFRIYAQHGGLGGRLGLPVTMPYLHNETTGGKAQDFEGGRILWDEQCGEFVVHYHDAA